MPVEASWARDASSGRAAARAIGLLLRAENVATLNAQGYTAPYADWASRGMGAGGAAIYNDANAFKSLMIVGNSSSGGNRKVGVWDHLAVHGDLTWTTCPEGQYICGIEFWHGCGWSWYDEVLRVRCCSL